MIAVCLSLFTVGGHFALFPNIIRQIYGKHATALYGWCFTSTGMASMLIEALILSPAGNRFILMFYITGGFTVISFIMLIFVFDSKRFVPDWVKIFNCGQTETRKVSMMKTTRAKSYQHDVDYGSIIREARNTL